MTFDSFIFSFSNLNKKLLFIYQLYYAAKFIEVKPYPWLEKLEKSVKKLPQKLIGYLTAIYRGKMTKNRLYIPLGGSYRARTCDLTNVNRTL